MDVIRGLDKIRSWGNHLVIERQNREGRFDCSGRPKQMPNTPFVRRDLFRLRLYTLTLFEGICPRTCVCVCVCWRAQGKAEDITLVLG